MPTRERCTQTSKRQLKLLVVPRELFIGDSIESISFVTERISTLCGGRRLGTKGRSWSKRVVHVETGKIYPNVRAAAADLRMAPMTVYRRLAGETQFRHGYKADFEWVE